MPCSDTNCACAAACACAEFAKEYGNAGEFPDAAAAAAHICAWFA